MRFNHLSDWLAWQETLNPVEIDLGLDRISAVLTQAGLSSTFDCPLITVAGTNGKGSVVSMLEAMAMAAGLKVCSYTSPHLFHYNERIKINAQPVADDILCEAFERIDHARRDTQLTYFEFGTLAAIDLFFREQPELVILEVGLGGRLDAVNIMDADVSILTSIAIDHVDWLGENRESIGYEKAGIIRSGKPVVCGDRNPPASVVDFAKKLQCDLVQIGRDYDAINMTDNKKPDGLWKLQSCYGDLDEVPEPSLQGEFQKSNAATAIVALQALQAEGLLLLSADQQSRSEQFDRALVTGLNNINLQGRFQQISNTPQVFVDVAHNPQAAQVLAGQINSLPIARNKTWAVVAMLADKDVSGVLKNVCDEIDCWCFAGLENINRGLDVETLAELGREIVINRCTIQPDTVLLAETVARACELVLSKASRDDRIIIFGSFYTVAEAMQYFSKLKNDAHV